MANLDVPRRAIVGPCGHKYPHMGAPVVDLDIAAGSPQAMVAVRLCDVAPSGRSARVSFGILNLTHATSDAFPRALEPGPRGRRCA